MPRLTRLAVRLALSNLLAGASLGGALLLDEALGPGSPGWLWRWRPLHVELMLVGWIALLAVGVAHWILPRYVDGRPPRGPAWPPRVAVLGLAAGPWLLGLGAGLQLAPLSTAGRLAELLGALAFAGHTWTRVRAALAAGATTGAARRTARSGPSSEA